MKREWVLLCCVFGLIITSDLHAKKKSGFDEQKYKYTLSICAIFKDDLPYLKEWVEHHKTLGFQHFYLYKSGCNDGDDSVVEPYILAGIVEFIDWPTPNEENLSVLQEAVYDDCIKRAAGVTQCLTIMDMDEFVIIQKSDLLLSMKVFEADPKIGGVEVYWQFCKIFWIEKVSDRQRVETIEIKAISNDGLNRRVASIFKPDTIAQWNINDVDYQPGYFGVIMDFGAYPVIDSAN